MVVLGDDTGAKKWRIITVISAVILLAVGIFIVGKLFTTNPLIGTWYSDDGTVKMVVEDKKAKVVLADSEEKAEFSYTSDRTLKLVSFELKEKKADENALLQAMNASFEYSIDGGVLTLTEREYSEQLVFKKQ